jgi:alpha-glucosidase
MSKIIILTILLLVRAICIAGPDRLDIKSPDGKLICKLSSAKKQLNLSVLFNGRQIINPSSLIFKIGGKEITSDVTLVKNENYKVNETYLWNGLHSVSADRCNGSVVWIHQTGTKNDYVLEVKVFNDAVAFRFKVPGNENVVREPDEATVFKLPGGSTVWYHDLYMHYEGIHVKKLIDTIPSGEWAAPPLTIKLPDNAGYASITEANLVNYAGMAFQTDGEKGFTVRLGHSHPPSYPYVLRYTKEDVARVSRIAEFTGTITTPWRVIMIGKDLNTLVNCDAVNDLCPAPDKELFPNGIKTDWIKPGRAVWKYLDGGGDGTLSVMKKFSKEASELGFEYNILEGFWSRWPDDSVKALVDYSNKLGVGIIVWKHSRDLRDPVKRKEFLRHLNDLGISGIKIDFFDHEAKEVIDLYESIAKESAAFKLLLIFHGANKPTGLARTYPNILIYEGVKGMEASKLSDRATHETTIPFTRMLAGPADYTLCHYGARRQNTTWVHQTATAAIFAAPVITFASTPANILINPCAGMVKSIPSVWDETIVLPPSEIGELAVFAQRKGTTWFVSVINGLQPKKIRVPLKFLGDKVYNTLLLSDDAGNPASAVIGSKELKKEDILDIELGIGGGYMARFTVK